MKEQAVSKINKVGKISNVIALIAKILVGIGMALLLIATIVCFAIPEELCTITINTDMAMNMDFSSIGITMTEEDIIELKTKIENDLQENPDDSFEEVVFIETGVAMKDAVQQIKITLKDCAWLLLMLFAGLTMTFITLIFIGGLCKAFRDCQSPFEDKVIKKMQHFAYALIPWAIVSTVTNSVSETLVNNKLSLTFTVDLGMILVVLVVLVLVYIFKYGAVLQQESDETL